MRKKKLTPLEERFELFTFFLNDIDNFIDKRDIIEKFPDQIKLLDEIVRGTKIHELIRENNIREFEKIEQEKRDKIDRKRKGIREVITIKEITEEDIEREILQVHQKTIQTKLSLNPSYFGQKSFVLMNYNYFGENEIKEMSSIIKSRIKDLLLECFENVKDPYKETKKLLRESKEFILCNKKYNLDDETPEKILVLKNEMYNDNNLINNKINQNMRIFNLLSDMEKNNKLIHQFIYDNEIENLNKQNEDIGINLKKQYQTISSISDKYGSIINNDFKYTRNSFSNNRYYSNLQSSKIKREYISLSKSNFMNKQLSRPKTSSSRVETSASNFKSYSNNLTLSNNFGKKLNVSTPSINHSLFNKKKNIINENLKDLLDANEIQYLTNHGLSIDNKIDYSSFNYDYSKLIKLRNTKKSQRLNKKYPIFAISQNMLNFGNVFIFPSIDNKVKKKDYKVYSVRDKKKKVKRTKN